jgi:hypothetical protein
VFPIVHFAIPGDLQSRTGGYAWDRRIIAELEALGMTVQVLPLSARFPHPDAAALADAAARVAALPDGAVLIADGLAWGVLDTVAQAHAQRLCIIALCHHPLALESGLSPQSAAALHDSEGRALRAAAAILVTSDETARTLVSQFDLSAHLHALVIKYGLAERIAFTGSCETPAEEYAHADVFVLPSRYEGYGMVFAEALAHGLPVIAARAGAVPDVVPPDAGLLVPVDDSEALAMALRRVLTDAALRSQLRAGALRAAAALPRWQDTGRRIANLIANLTGTTSIK